MAVSNIFFNSSLPRSGSTLMQNILAQNPQFHCSPTSGIAAALHMARVQFEQNDTFIAQDQATVRKGHKGFCAGALVGYYNAITDKPIVVDKSRGWLPYFEWLRSWWPNPRMIVCIRDLRAIVSSMEKIYRRTRETDVGLFEGPARAVLGMMGVNNRVGSWMNSNPVGLGVVGMIDAIQKGVIKQCHVVRYEDLTSNPRATMTRVYEYLGLPCFEHNFDNVEQVTQEDDAKHSIYGDHKIRTKVEPVPPDYKQIIGDEMCAHVVQSFQLYYKTFYPEVRG